MAVEAWIKDVDGTLVAVAPLHREDLTLKGTGTTEWPTTLSPDVEIRVDGIHVANMKATWSTPRVPNPGSYVTISTTGLGV